MMDKKRKTLFSLLGGLALIIVIVLIIFLVSNKVSDVNVTCSTESCELESTTVLSLDPNNVSVVDVTCRTESCELESSNVLAWMNQEIEPCDDFYEFACGKFLKENPMPDDKSEVDAFTLTDDKVKANLKAILEEPIRATEKEPLRIVKTYYKNCVETTKIEEKTEEIIKNNLESIGGWPTVVGDEWNKNGTWSWPKAKEILDKNRYWTNFLFKPVVPINKNNNTGDSYIEAYHRYQVDLAVLSGANQSAAEEEMKAALDLEIALSETLLSHPNSNDKFTDLLDKTPPRVVANYFSGKLVYEFAGYMTEKFRKRNQKFLTETTGQVQPNPRWLKCVNYVMKYFSNEVVAPYIRRHFKVQDEAKAHEMVVNIKKEFRIMVSESSWIDDKTKVEAFKKLDAIVAKIGYDRDLLKDSKIVEHYNSNPAPIINGRLYDSVFENSFSSNDRLNQILRRLYDHKDLSSDSDVFKVGASFLPSKNIIRIPNAILQGMFFNADRPQYMNYGRFGFVIGHELTHGFDNNGLKFDEKGNLRNWWSENSKKTFDEKARCFIDQYSNFTEPLTKLKVNGVITLGENIADNGGVKESYRAYERWAKKNPEKKLPNLDYSPQQMFWISVAQTWCSSQRKELAKTLILRDVHSPKRFRVIGPLRNSKEFATDFNCPATSKMNPRDKCEIW